MKIAVAYDNGEIGGHFGHCECFAVYDYYGEYVHECKKKLVESTDRHGHQQMAELMQELGVEAVIVSQMGDEAKSLLLSMGIIPVPGYTGDADTAADMLVTGQLPPPGADGGCSGGCGGCGGSCGGHDHDDGDGGCGCGGGCCGH